MIVSAASRAHLTYCTNIHPGESWRDVLANLERHVRAIKDRVAPDRAFGVGLRLSAAAASTLARPEELEAFRAFLDRHGLYVFTLNGFPYGTFHGTRVKEEVYRPDWLEEPRLEYSLRLAEILADLLPWEPGLEGSVSTVPGAFKSRVRDEEDAVRMADRLVRCAAGLHDLNERRGRVITLGLEPEPCCLLETVVETVVFFERYLFSREAVKRMGQLVGLNPGDAAEALRRHLGVCLDACHAAVEFEEPVTAVRALEAAGIRISKLQIGAGLRVRRPTARDLEDLRALDDGVYLHQVVARNGWDLARYTDLPEAIAAAEGAPEGADEWRVHFHVPVFADRLGPFETTQAFLGELLDLHAREGVSPHLEVETYTWDVLPESLRGMDVVEAICRELRWVEDRIRS